MLIETPKSTAEMPRYRCHKEVWALRIKDVAGNRLYFFEPLFAPVDADEEMFSRYTPQIGDYYVVYSDGYKSFSPKKAFEEGYTPV